MPPHDALQPHPCLDDLIRRLIRAAADPADPAILEYTLKYARMLQEDAEAEAEPPHVRVLGMAVG